MNAKKSEIKAYFKCSLPQCKDKRFSLVHKFPKNHQRCKEWLEAFDNLRLYGTPHLRLIQQNVCCRHFRMTDYVHPESRVLNKMAVPSLNLKKLNELDKCRHEKTKREEHCADGWKFVECSEDEERKALEINKENTSNNTQNMEVSDKNSVNSLNHLVSEVINMEDVNFLNDSTTSSTKALLNDNIVSSSEDFGETTILTTDVEENSNSFKLLLNEGMIEITDSVLKLTIKVDILWLRHKCGCDQCLSENLIGLCEIDDDLQPVMATVIEETGRLEIIWNDGHTSTYNLNRLYQQAPKEQPALETPKYLLWNFQHTQYRDDLQAINWHDLIQNNAVIYKSLDRLQKSGVLIIDQLPKNDKDSLLRKSILTKLFNTSWDIFSTEKRKAFLKHHNKTPFTNCTFESMDKGLQVVTVPNDKESLKIPLILVDGFQAFENVPKNTYDFMIQTLLDYGFKDDKGFEYKLKLPVLSKNGHLERVFYMPYHLQNIKSQEFRTISKHFKILKDILSKQQNHWQVELNSEKMIIMDNYRLCWRLQEIPNDCELDCIYLERKHYLSSLNILRDN